MLPIPPSVGETPSGKQVCSFVSSYFSFKQNIICPSKGGNSNSNLPFMIVSFVDPEAFWPMVFLMPLLYVFPVAIYSAFRYRISRTQWRGIRFGLDGTVIKYANLYLWRGLVNVASLGVLIPYSDIKKYRYIANNACFGGILFRFEGRGKDLMTIHLTTYLMSIGFVIIALYGLQLMAASFFVSR